MQEQRDPNELIAQEFAMREPVIVLPEALAVVGGDRDPRVIEEAPRRNAGQQGADLVVGELNFARIARPVEADVVAIVRQLIARDRAHRVDPLRRKLPLPVRFGECGVEIDCIGV